MIKTLKNKYLYINLAGWIILIKLLQYIYPEQDGSFFGNFSIGYLYFISGLYLYRRYKKQGFKGTLISVILSKIKQYGTKI
jgi:hypothetical protein